MTKHRPATVRSPQCWKHLRDWKRVYWKRDRRAGKVEAREDGGGTGLGTGKPGTRATVGELALANPTTAAIE